MMRSLLTAATGMESQQLNIDTIANNLANVNTTAFKRSRANFHDLLYQTLKAPGQSSTVSTIVPEGIQIGAGVKLSSVGKLFSQGGARITERNLDLQIEGNGFFRIQRDDGNTLYSRDGHFVPDREGRLVTTDGFALVPNITIPENFEPGSFNVGIDGTVSVKVNNKSQDLGQILIANFNNPSGLSSIGRNFYLSTEASGDPIVGIPQQNGLGSISQGQLENSNVNIVEEMVNMITGQRAYELNAKVIQTADSILQITNNVIS